MKAIIIAAGLGSRLASLTEDLPKCLIDVGGKRIVDHQLAAFRTNGITDISMVRGYKAERITIPDIQYYFNDNYKVNNILASLMYAEPAMNDAFIASYSDIIFEPSVVQKLLTTTADISIVVDTAWQGAYNGRTEHPLIEAEKVIFDEHGNVREIGKHITLSDAPHGEFIGMLLCTQTGAAIFKKRYHQAKTAHTGKPFVQAKTFDKAYLTDFIQYLTHEGIKTHCVPIEGGWCEIDTPQDIQRATTMIGRSDA